MQIFNVKNLFKRTNRLLFVTILLFVLLLIMIFMQKRLL